MGCGNLTFDARSLQEYTDAISGKKFSEEIAREINEANEKTSVLTVALQEITEKTETLSNLFDKISSNSTVILVVGIFSVIISTVLLILLRKSMSSRSFFHWLAMIW